MQVPHGDWGKLVPYQYDEGTNFKEWLEFRGLNRIIIDILEWDREEIQTKVYVPKESDTLGRHAYLFLKQNYFIDNIEVPFCYVLADLIYGLENREINHIIVSLEMKKNLYGLIDGIRTHLIETLEQGKDIVGVKAPIIPEYGFIIKPKGSLYPPKNNIQEVIEFYSREDKSIKDAISNLYCNYAVLRRVKDGKEIIFEVPY